MNCLEPKQGRRVWASYLELRDMDNTKDCDMSGVRQKVGRKGGGGGGGGGSGVPKT